MRSYWEYEVVEDIWNPEVILKEEIKNVLLEVEEKLNDISKYDEKVLNNKDNILNKLQNFLWKVIIKEESLEDFQLLYSYKSNEIYYLESELWKDWFSTSVYHELRHAVHVFFQKKWRLTKSIVEDNERLLENNWVWNFLKNSFEDYTYNVDEVTEASRSINEEMSKLELIDMNKLWEDLYEVLWGIVNIENVSKWFVWIYNYINSWVIFNWLTLWDIQSIEYSNFLKKEYRDYLDYLKNNDLAEYIDFSWTDYFITLTDGQNEKILNLMIKKLPELYANQKLQYFFSVSKNYSEEIYDQVAESSKYMFWNQLDTELVKPEMYARIFEHRRIYNDNEVNRKDESELRSYLSEENIVKLFGKQSHNYNLIKSFLKKDPFWNDNLWLYIELMNWLVHQESLQKIDMYEPKVMAW